MGLFYGGVPTWLIEWATEQGIAAAVETGTYKGDSADLLATAFGSCTTIELDPALADIARTRFADRSDVRVVHDSSRTALRDALAALDRPAFLWLDAHWSGGITAGADDPCPLMDELALVAASAHPHIVAVDDMRQFGFNEEGWPRLPEICDALRAMSRSVFVVDDVIIGVPHALEASFTAIQPAAFRQARILFPVWDVIEAADTARRRPPLRRRVRRVASRLKQRAQRRNR